MRSYYIADNGQQRGPYPPEQLPAQGLRPDTLVWADGMAQWQRADQVPELQGVFPAAGPAAAPAAPTGGYPGYPGYPNPAAAGPANPVNAPNYPATPYAGGYPTMPQSAVPPDVSGKKIGAGLCGILLGTFGVHKFMLGYTGAGVTMLLVSLLSCFIAAPVMHIIGLVEGIMYLTKTDEQFYQEYIVNRKEWF